MNLRLPRLDRTLLAGMGLLLAACSAAPSTRVSVVDPPVATATAPATQPPILPATATLEPATATAVVTMLTATPVLPTATIMPATPSPTRSAPPAPADDFGPAPELKTEVWLNSEQPLRLVDLRGKVVLVDFWTFG